MNSLATKPPALLKLLDRVFPPEPSGFRSDEQMTTHEVAKASSSMGGYLAELGEEQASQLAVLDFGCGWGGETLWLASKVGSVCGVDVDRSAIDQAQKALQSFGVSNCRFEWSQDGRLPFESESFDAVFSTDVFEHVMDLELAYSEIFRVLKPGGRLITKFGPLFYSPHGYHLYWACKVPWAHVVFGLDAIAAMRALRGGHKSIPSTWQDLGLNGRRFRDYVAGAANAGFVLDRFEPIAVKSLRTLTRVPAIKDYFIFGIDCAIHKPGGSKATAN